MKEKALSHGSSLLVGLACVWLLGGLGVAERAFAGTPATALKSGQAVGTFTAGGKTVKLSHAAAFVDKKEKDKPTILLISDEEVPAASWTSEFQLMEYRMDHHFAGVCFWLDKNREVFRTDYYEPGDPMSTSASGIFDLKIDSPPGKVLAGSASSTQAATKLSHPVTLDLTFQATLK